MNKDLKPKTVKTVELENLVTCTLINFLLNAKELGWKEKEPFQKWYLNLSPKQMRKLSDKLLDIMAGDVKTKK
jgi:hypothetical protein